MTLSLRTGRQHLDDVGEDHFVVVADLLPEDDFAFFVHNVVDGDFLSYFGHGAEKGGDPSAEFGVCA